MLKLLVGLCLIIATFTLLIVADNYSYSLLTAEEKAEYQAEQAALAEQKATDEAGKKIRQQELKNKAYKEVSKDDLTDWFALNFSNFALWFGILVGFIMAIKVFTGMTKSNHPF